MSREFIIKNALISFLAMTTIAAVSEEALAAYKIRGIVLNMESGGPVKLAEVFISGTTHGSITNDSGEFELGTSYLPCQLVVSHIAYAPFSRLIDLESLPYVTIKLIPYEHEIKEITIESISMRKENLELFREAFLGTDEIAGACRILNDSVLSFAWDSLVFSASAYQPVLIDNPKLGYRIKIILEDFKLIFDPDIYHKIHKSGKKKPSPEGAVYQTLCDFHFTPYPPANGGKQKRIERTRLRAYYGSRMHFLRSVYSGELKANGYLISPYFQQVSMSGYENLNILHGIRFIFLDPDGYPEKLLIVPEDPLEISFFRDHSGVPIDLNRDNGNYVIPLQSKLTYGKNECMVRYNGTTFDYSLIFHGHIGGQRISTMLPDDYNPWY